tara:strand:+ start:60 stop:653 length:594 start_codon:yes stop_codon:yes gene_type:complete
MHKFIFIISFFSLLISCSSSDDSVSAEISEEKVQQLYSCVSYDDILDPSSTNQNDLMQYWDKFVNDVKCTVEVDFGEVNSNLNIFFEYATFAQVTAGVTSDHIAYSTFTGYCNDTRVNVGVLYDAWVDKNLLQRLWIMYHEFGHDVYKYEHSTSTADIMYPSSTREDIDVNDFIDAKDRMFKRSFPGIKYINCPSNN